MEDDDEFGDLYTDVLRTFPSSASADQPHPSSSPPPPFNPLVDLNPQDHHEELMMCQVPDSGFASSSKDSNQTLVAGAPTDSVVVTGVGESVQNSVDSDKLADGEVGKDDDLARVSGNSALDSPKRSGSRVLESGEEKLNGAREDLEGGDRPCVDVVKDEGDDRGDASREKCVSFDIQEGDTEIVDVGLEPIISGLLIQGAADGVENGADEGDDWDSDSEDDLQIVLNDNNHGPMAVGGVAVASDDEDEDGEPLVIVADDDLNLQPMEEQEWGEDAAQSTDADRKDIGEVGKVNGKNAAAPKIGYSSHGYHPFHSQFKVSDKCCLKPGNLYVEFVFSLVGIQNATLLVIDVQ